jgi:ATP-dependent Clp protease ATP-binding subunit ClpC
MDSLSTGIHSFLSFFQLHPSDSTDRTEFLAYLNLWLLWAAAGTDSDSSEENLIDQPDSSAPADPQDAELLLKNIEESLGANYNFNLSRAKHVCLSLNSRTIDLYPLLIVDGSETLCLNQSKRGAFVYVDRHGRSRDIQIGNPLFEEIADGLVEKGWYRAALKALDAGTEPLPRSLEHRIYSVRCLLACEHFKNKLYREAALEFERAMKIKSHMPQLFYNLALTYGRLREYRNAIALLNRLTRIKPNQPKTFELLGDFYFNLGEWERSSALYQKAAGLTENKTALQGKMARSEEKIQKPKGGETKKEEEERFSVHSCLQDLTLEAELGNFNPVLGRERELEQIQQILACQSKKNVLVLGDPGVGKTALIQELASRIACGQVSVRLQHKRLIRVNMGALLAGAKFRGQFEERLMQLIREVKKLNCILFVDDIHQIVSGGAGKANSMESAHFLKPALMNDEIQMIGATNHEEFRNSIEKDNSFLRCFQQLKLEEPDQETLMNILRAYRVSLENFHHVIINDESLETSLMWVKILLRDRALPDKALDVLDRSSARISIQEKSAIVSSESVLETISEMSGVPLSRMSVTEKSHYRNIEKFMGSRVVGQRNAIMTVSKVLRTSKMRMHLNPVRPKGIFLFVGPTGVGKTELAKAMAEFLFGHEDKIVRIDMSEYMERYSASRLIGTSPGYVGYYDQNQLVDKIRSNPYSLILLDEIEKADAQLLNIFLQVFDAGRLTDGKGKIAYFDNCTIVMTSNIGTYLFAQNKLGYGAENADNHVTHSDLLKEVKRFFQPEFLNRIDEIVFFDPLTPGDVREIANLKLKTVFEQFSHGGKQLNVEESVLTEVCKLGYDYEYGARNLERILRRYLLDKLANLALSEEWPEVNEIDAVWNQGEVVLKTDSPAAPAETATPQVDQQFIEDSIV